MATLKLLLRLIGALLAVGCLLPLIAMVATAPRGGSVSDEGIRAISLAAALYAFPMSISLGRYPTLQEIYASSPTQRSIGIGLVVAVWIVAALALLAAWHYLRPVWRSWPAAARRVAVTVGCALSVALLAGPLISPPGPARISVEVSHHMGPMPDTTWNFSQGGHVEMQRPGYFETALGRLAGLHPRLIRIDHIYDYYRVVSIDTHGFPQYDWSKLDRVVDAIRHIGAEPLMCLSYSPPYIGQTDPYGPPTDLGQWEGMVYKTVTHFNVDRHDQIEYWEVWNEPNTGNFWHGSLDDYLALYEATASGVKRADPSAKVGGPGAYSVERFGPAFELINEKSFVDALITASKSKHLPLDFVSWHLYEKSPSAFAENIRRHQSWLAGVTPQPELLLTEWNWSAEPAPEYDTGATDAFVAGTAATLNSAPLTGAFFFEPIDSEAGQWGLLRPDGSPKPVLDTFRMLSALQGDRLEVTSTSTDVGAMATINDKTVKILVWNLGERSSRAVEASLTLRGLPGSGPYSALIDSGSGKQATVDLRVVSGAGTLDLVMAPHDVQLITVQING